MRNAIDSLPQKHHVHIQTAVAVIGIVLAGCAGPIAPPSDDAPSREDIFVLRSVPLAHNRDGNWCTAERAGFAPLRTPALLETSFAFWSVDTDRASGRIANPRSNQVTTARGCFGFTEDAKVFNFYLEAQLGSLMVTGRGECTQLRADFPEKGLNSVRCTVPLSSSSDVYVGGVLTTNTIGSKATIGELTDPPGYTQASIATLRLWRKR